MNILITGGAGFIGSHVIEHHLDRGDEVVAVDDLSTGNRSNIRDFERNPRFRFVPSDITDYPELDHAVRAADRIYHLAAVVGMFRVLREPVRVTQVNVCATERLLETIAAAGHHPQVVIASSSSVYSHCHSRDLREDDELGWKCYCKLHHGVPILRAESEDFREAYDGAIKGLTYEQKLKVMRILPVTSLMSKAQLSKYLEAVQDDFAKRGVVLAFPMEQAA